MLLLEIGNPNVAFAPTASVTSDNGAVQTHYPVAFREIWAREFYHWNVCSGLNMNEISSRVDSRRVFAGGITVGFADGSVKFISVGSFLARTPSVEEYGIPTTSLCGFTGGVVIMDATPNLGIRYPFWALGEQ
jgi:prepilin-type processing-associated H-X9-DG protein